MPARSSSSKTARRCWPSCRRRWRNRRARWRSARARARRVDEDERITTFVESLERAAGVMDPAAATSQRRSSLQEAVPVEQQALQQLLRAESAFREVQVSMQQSNARRRRLADCAQFHGDVRARDGPGEEPVRERVAAVARNNQQELDEAIRKLKELAERQERLAQERIAGSQHSANNAGSRSSCVAKPRICVGGWRS